VCISENKLGNTSEPQRGSGVSVNIAMRKMQVQLHKCKRKRVSQ